MTRISLFTIRSCLYAFTAIALLIASSGVSNASILVAGDTIKVNRHTAFGGGYGGGEFCLFKKETDGSWTELGKTFCLERLEDIPLDTEIRVGALSDRVVSGNTTKNNPDLLDVRTDFLYSAYRSGALATFDLDGNMTKFQYSSGIWANALQQAIWYIEDEDNDFTPWDYKEEAELLFNYADQHAAGFSSNVFVLNLFRGDTPQSALDQFDPLDASTWDDQSALANYHLQDLVWQVDPVPEPATLAIWSVMGVGGLLIARRRLRRR